MSSGTSGPSQSRTSRVGSYCFCIEGLPRGFTWQDLKDLIRREARHGIWTEVYHGPDGIIGEIGYVRVQRGEEADNLYNYLVQFRGYKVHLFDTSQAVAQKIRCNCNGPCIATQRSQYAAAIQRLAASPSWISVPPHKSFPQPVATYAGQPLAQYTSTPGPPPMAHYPVQSLEANMAGLRLNNSEPYTQLQMIVIGLKSPNPEIQARANAAVKLTLAQLSTLEQKQAWVMGLQAETARLFPQQTHTVNPDGLPVNSSQGVVRTESTSVFVSRLNFKATAIDIKQQFSKGELRPLNCTLQEDQATGKSRGYATVQYASAQDARKAVNMFNGQKFMGMAISVRLDKEQVAVNPPASASSSASGGSNHASSSSGRGRNNAGSGSASKSAAAQSRANAGPVIANGSVIRK